MPSINAEVKSLLKWALIGVVVGGIVHVGQVVYSGLKAKEARVGSPIPHTVVLHETVVSPNGTVYKGANFTRAVRSDGSSLLWRAYENDNGPAYNFMTYSERIIQFASGIKVTVNELTRMKSTIAYTVNSGRWQRDPASKCMNSFAGVPMVDSPPDVISGEETVSGYRAVRITRNNSTIWYALDFGCAMVKDRTEWAGQGYSEKSLVKLIPGEPDTSLYAIDGSIKEAPPSEMMLRPGLPMTSQNTELLRRLDETYYKHRIVR